MSQELQGEHAEDDERGLHLRKPVSVERDEVQKSFDRRAAGFVETLGIEFVSGTPYRIEGVMMVKDSIRQPHGFLHGGATLALLETLASAGTELWTNLDEELLFGVDVHVRHRNSVAEGAVHGFAEFERQEMSKTGAIKQFWKVYALDEQGLTVSEGEVVTKIVSREYLAKRRERNAQRSA